MSLHDACHADVVRQFLEGVDWHSKHGNYPKDVTDLLALRAVEYLASPTEGSLTELQTAAETTEKFYVERLYSKDDTEITVQEGKIVIRRISQ